MHTWEWEQSSSRSLQICCRFVAHESLLNERLSCSSILYLHCRNHFSVTVQGIIEPICQNGTTPDISRRTAEKGLEHWTCGTVRGLGPIQPYNPLAVLMDVPGAPLGSLLASACFCRMSCACACPCVGRTQVPGLTECAGPQDLPSNVTVVCQTCID